MRCMATGGGFAARGAVGYCAVGENCWSDPSRMCARPVGLRRVHLRGHPNILKRLVVQFAGCNLGLLLLLLRQLIGVGTPRSLQGRAAAVFSALFRRLGDLWGCLRRLLTLSIVDFGQNCLVTAPSPLPPIRVSVETSTSGC